MEEKPVEVIQTNEKEFLVGENRVFLDDDTIQNIILVGDTDAMTAKALVDCLTGLTRGIDGKIRTLVDLNMAGKASSEMRTMGRVMIQDDKTGKVALFGLHPVARVLASFIIGVTGGKNIRFFKTRDEALVWLRE
jgi:hypothetical protein